MKRGLKYEFNSIIAILCILAMTLFIMLYLHNHPQKWDFTKEKLNTLSEQSVLQVKAITSPIKAIAFIAGGKNNKVENLLKLYRENNLNFSYEYVDPNKNPKKASEYDVASDVVIFLESKGNRERINDVTEENITNAIIRLTTQERKQIYVLTGHEQLVLNTLPKGMTKNSMSILAKSLGKEIYDVKPLNLLEQPEASIATDPKTTFAAEVPKDASIVIVADPKTAFFAVESDALKKYYENGGNILWLIGEKFEKSNAKILNDIGISFSDGFVDDDMSKMLGADEFMTVVGINSATDITVGFNNAVCLFPLCRNIVFPKESKDIIFTPFALTSSKSKIITRDGAIQPNSQEGSSCVGLAFEKGKSRSIVISSALAVSDATITQGENKNLFLNCVAWLSQEENLISIRPKDQNVTLLTLTDESTFFIFFFSVVFPPCIFASLWLSIRIAKRFGSNKK